MTERKTKDKNIYFLYPRRIEKIEENYEVVEYIPPGGYILEKRLFKKDEIFSLFHSYLRVEKYPGYGWVSYRFLRPVIMGGVKEEYIQREKSRLIGIARSLLDKYEEGEISFRLREGYFPDKVHNFSKGKVVERSDVSGLHPISEQTSEVWVELTEGIVPVIGVYFPPDGAPFLFCI